MRANRIDKVTMRENGDENKVSAEHSSRNNKEEKQKSAQIEFYYSFVDSTN